MDKKNIAVIVIIVIMVALMAYVFIASAGVPKKDPNVLITIEDTEVTTDEFKKYVYIRNEADGDIAKETTIEEKQTLLDEFTKVKLYVNAADSKNISVPAESVEGFKTEYSGKAAIFANYGISEEDYLRYSEDAYKQSELSNNLSNYFELPEGAYEALLESYSGDQKTYAFRLMTFSYEEPASGDVESGDTAAESGDVEDKTRETVLATAQSVLEKLNSGDDFGELAKTYSSYRITFKGNGYELINGDVEYATSPIIESKLGNDKLYTKIKEMTAGEVSEVIEDDENNTLYILKLESVEEGFVGEAEQELKDVLIKQYEEALVIEDVHYHINDVALIKIY